MNFKRRDLPKREARYNRKTETKGNRTMTNNKKKENLIRCRRTYAERGAKLVEITHLDGRKSGIANPKAVKAVMDALKVELDRQIEELGGDETRSGLDEVVRDWMLREHPEERKFMEDFSETVTFRELVERMEAGEDFYDILGSTESAQREICFRRLVELTGKEYNHFYYTWLSRGDKAKYDEYMAKRKAAVAGGRRRRKGK